MVRNVVAAVAGYVALYVLTIILFSIAFLILGPDGSYLPGSYNVSSIWIVVSILLGLAAAAGGGFLCKMIGKTDTSVWILAGIAVVLGLVLAYMQMNAVVPVEVRSGDVPIMEAMMKAQQPDWVGFVMTIVHGIGAIVGGRLLPTRHSPGE